MALRKRAKHPGQEIRRLCLEPHGLSVTEAAKGLGVTRSNLSQVLNGHRGISPEMAIRLARAFDTVAMGWLHMQARYDFDQARTKAAKIESQVHVFGRKRRPGDGSNRR